MDNSVLTILIVEDNADDLLLIQRAIVKSRLVNPISVVRDGEEAICYIAGTGPYADRAAYPLPFLMLLDLHMPKRNGFEVLSWLRSRPAFQKMKVAVLTASPDQHDYKRAMDLGADSYFNKPGSLSEFVDLMLRLQGNWLLLNGTVSSYQKPHERINPVSETTRHVSSSIA